jgi:hypothetical protein
MASAAFDGLPAASAFGFVGEMYRDMEQATHQDVTTLVYIKPMEEAQGGVGWQLRAS